MYGNKPNVKHLLLFESTWYIFKYKENSDKFEANSDLGIFLGYSNNSRAYHVYNLRTSIVMESINVVIGDSEANKLIESKDINVFGD